MTDLAGEIAGLSTGEAVETSLATNQRVIARVTDGIYRKPGSAIRELVSNGYDADASRVIVQTDAPRFDRITVEDDGNGMTPDEVAHLIKNIGGSAKRTTLGGELGLAQEADPTLSPGGRRLIGKLGIGIFSVSQLTRSFQITTKVRGDQYRTIAQVRLHQFSDRPGDLDQEKKFEAGVAKIHRERDPDEDSHGTTIVLNGIRPQTKKTLQSSEIWDNVDRPVREDDDEPVRHIPNFHIGRSQGDDYVTADVEDVTSLPWSPEDSPRDRFKLLVNSVWELAETVNPNPKLELIFDNYLQMIWELGLALPVEYVDGHLFDEPASDWAQFFQLSNRSSGSAKEIATDNEDGPVRGLLELEDGLDAAGFEVIVDNIQVLRPLRYRDLPVTRHSLRRPLVFLGRASEEFEGYDADISAGPLRFEAYLFWTPKVVPIDHRGVLVRIHDSSGLPFDPTFFRYQVSEQTRLRQIVCEIFVSEGLEPALNIDRESFNTSHPHMVYIARWTHSALRQLATAQKKVAAAERMLAGDAAWREKLGELDLIVDKANQRVTDGEGVVPEVAIVPPEFELEPVKNVRYRFSREEVLPSVWRGRDIHRTEPTVEAITKVLSIYGLLDGLSAWEQTELLGSIAQIIRRGYE